MVLIYIEAFCVYYLFLTKEISDFLLLIVIYNKISYRRQIGKARLCWRQDIVKERTFLMASILFLCILLPWQHSSALCTSATRPNFNFPFTNNQTAKNCFNFAKKSLIATVLV